MGEASSTVDIQKSSKTEDVQKKSKIKALKSEFKKIMWPDKDTIVKKTIAVIVVTAVLALVIAMIDYMVEFGLNQIM